MNINQLFNQHDFALGVLCTVLFITVIVADLWFAGSGRIVLGLGHAGIVLLGLAARSPLFVFMLATVASVATAVIGVAEFQASADSAALANRGLVLAVIWVNAVLVHSLRRAPALSRSPADFPESDNLFQAVFNQTFQFVAALDPDGNIVEANQTLQDYAGLTKREIASMPIWLLPIFRADPAARQRLREAVAAAAAGDFIRDEFDVSGVSEQSTVIDFSLKPIREENGTIRWIIMEARDITEGRTQQEMLVQAQKMEAMGELTAGVAHDFNNLLTRIVGNLELVEKGIDGNAKLKDRLRRAIDTAFSGQTLTQQLLAFSRRQSLNPAVIDVNTLLRGMEQIYGSLGESIEVEFDLEEGLPRCEVDATLLESALLNLAINARDAMPGGGTLRFTTTNARFEERHQGEVADLPPGEYVCTAVSDTGSGISEKIASQVFDPFFTTKPEGQGTGLGLSMVYGFVKQSGGDVKIYSEEGKGTTIRLYLPATDKPPPIADRGAETPVTAEEANGETVLLVEDDREIREIVLETMTEIGCRVEAADNGDAAVDLIRAGNTYDLVFTDMVMDGEAQGVDVARAARAANPGIPVIFCSGFPRHRRNHQGALLEGAIFIAKPFHQEQLISAIKRALAGRAEVPSSRDTSF